MTQTDQNLAGAARMDITLKNLTGLTLHQYQDNIDGEQPISEFVVDAGLEKPTFESRGTALKPSTEMVIIHNLVNMVSKYLGYIAI